MPEAIRVRGARVNNLVDVDVDIPKRQLTVFTGVSGSGKSSLVFGTIATESRRLINETYSAFLQGFMPNLGRPDADSLENLSAAIIVDQERMGANSRSTVGTATDVNAVLRIVFSRLSVPLVGPATRFSFNLPDGMCPGCEGVGRTSSLDLSAILDESRSLNEGALLAPNFTVGSWYWKVFAESGRLDPDVPIADYSAEQREFLLNSGPTKIKASGINMTYEGLLPKVKRLFLNPDKEPGQKHIRDFVDRAVTMEVCPDCRGARLNEAAREATVAGRTLPECLGMQINDLADFLAGLDEPSVSPLLNTLNEALGSLVEIGLGYLSLDRESGTLSGGEAQRVKMVRHLGSALTDVTYVFDEPTVGLHPHDIGRMNRLLERLRDKGNTVLVVEHKPDVIAIADHVIDMGPGAGGNGGHVTYTGDVEGLRSSGTITGEHLDRRNTLKAAVRTPTGALQIREATTHNLDRVSVDVPTGVLVVVTGVAGSGKSSLIHGSLPGRDGVLVVDQSAIRGSRRSNPATYTGLLDPIRSAFAKANGVKPAMFSANSEGACPKCSGLGVVYTDLVTTAGVASTCEECRGRRFTEQVLGYTFNGKNIHEVLSMSMAEAVTFFPSGAAHRILTRLVDNGIGYLTLGQPLNTLSGGERQRVKLAIARGSQPKLGAATYILDEPTSGLHMADIENLLSMLDRLVDQGNTAIVIEHSLAVMAHADWIIDIGPGAGHDGGQVVFEGSPHDLIDSGTLTGRHLNRYLANQAH